MQGASEPCAPRVSAKIPSSHTPYTALSYSNPVLSTMCYS